MAFLDTFVIPQADGSLLTTVYRKPTHTNQYLQWGSHHAISTKYSIISTFFHRAKDVCLPKKQLDEEHDHLQKVLTTCKYPRWALHRMKHKINNPVQSESSKNEKNKGTDNNSKSNTGRNYIAVTYIKGLSESIKTYARNMAYRFISKGARPSKTFWWCQKTKTT